MNMHIQEAAFSHYNLQSGEIQRLHPLLSDGVIVYFDRFSLCSKVELTSIRCFTISDFIQVFVHLRLLIKH